VKIKKGNFSQLYSFVAITSQHFIASNQKCGYFNQLLFLTGDGDVIFIIANEII